MNPLVPNSFNLHKVKLANRRTYQYCDQFPANYIHASSARLSGILHLALLFYQGTHGAIRSVPGCIADGVSFLPTCLTKPDDIACYTALSVAADLVGFLNALEIKEPIILVGHDWGAEVSWAFAEQYAQRLKMLVCISVPYRAPLTRPFTVPEFVELEGEDLTGYWLFTNEKDAGAIIDRNIPRFIDMVYRPHKTVNPHLFKAGTAKKIIIGKTNPTGPSDLMGAKEREHYIEFFEASGPDAPTRYHKSTPEWYAQEQELQLNPVLPVSLPILFVAPNHELFTTPQCINATKPYVPSLEVIRIEDCGHFALLEKPDEITSIVGDWVEKKLNAVTF
ncbi:hypothetical protein FRB95_009042 [Tulasnella sp. JGI-2019a]|nr:hypothetical protein FRB95_009042 [Tulasnella sp. JGI-2019a]